MDQSEKADVLFAPTEQAGKGSTRRLQCGHLYKSLVRFLTLPACGHITLSICDTKNSRMPRLYAAEDAEREHCKTASQDLYVSIM